MSDERQEDGLRPGDASRHRVVLEGGPYADAVVFVRDPRAGILMTGSLLADDEAASYRPTRTKGVYHYQHTTKVVATIPWPPKDATDASSGPQVHPKQPSSQPPTGG